MQQEEQLMEFRFEENFAEKYLGTIIDYVQENMQHKGYECDIKNILAKLAKMRISPELEITKHIPSDENSLYDTYNLDLKDLNVTEEVAQFEEKLKPLEIIISLPNTEQTLQTKFYQIKENAVIDNKIFEEIMQLSRLLYRAESANNQKDVFFTNKALNIKFEEYLISGQTLREQAAEYANKQSNQKRT
ncbi:hypothetical protein K9L97_02270 [Candidatus Woesearchaeota archaeon]|nr:hypothetical protein [Candidatus Woesearchaeota archaeon]